MGFLSVKVDTKGFGLDKTLANVAQSVMRIVAVQAAQDTADYVPMLTGSLTNRTQVKDGQIIYPGPYARYLYYGKVMVDPKTGSPWARKGRKKEPIDNKYLTFNKSSHKNAQAHWFEASKAMNLEKWKQVAAKAVTQFDK